MGSKINSAVSVLGGAALGAAAMYLFDPDQGESRRKDVRATAGDAVGATSDAVGSTWGAASDSAKSLAGSAGAYASKVGGKVSDHASNLSDRFGDAKDAVTGHVSDAASAASDHASGLASSLRKAIHRAIDGVTGSAGDAASAASDQATGLYASVRKAVGKAVDSVTGSASDAADSAKSTAKKVASKAKGKASDASAFLSDQADGASDTASKYAGKARDAHDDLHDRATSFFSKGKKAVHDATEEPSSPVAAVSGVTAGAVTVLAVGAGLMYFLDPERGHSRRAVASDKFFSFTRQTGKQARGYGRHLGNKFQGYQAKAQRYVPESWTGGNGDSAPKSDNGSSTPTTAAE